MRARWRGWLVGLLVAPAFLAPSILGAQELAERIGGMADGTVRLTYPARPDVEICDQGVRMGQNRMMWHSRGWVEEATNCRVGWVEIEAAIRDGSVDHVKLVRKLTARTADALDLGRVGAREAVVFLLDAARNGDRARRGEEDAIFPIILADTDGVWRELLVLARDRSVADEVRTTSLFWVGQEAAEVVSKGLTEVALDEEENQEVREAAVFALSQRPAPEGIPALMQVARTAREAETRRSAMFWLAESEDERVYAFFEEILLGRGGG